MSLADLIHAIGALTADELPAVAQALAGRMAAVLPRVVDTVPAPANATAGLVDAAQAAAALNIHESWLRSQARAGKLPFVQCGKYIRFDLADVKRALRERQTSAERSRSPRQSLG
jgi:excisionase family DNA binding protein